MRRTTRWTESA